MPDKAISEAIKQVASLMELAARTAPKTKGEDFIMTMTLGEEKIAELAKAMVEFGLARNKKSFDRDGANVSKSTAVVLIGLKNAATVGLNCGACGYATCKQLEEATVIDGEFRGPICSYRHLDLGIALGSAAKMAQIHNVDNRIIYRIGAAARWKRIVDWDLVMGIPLSATGKSIYFDR